MTSGPIYVQAGEVEVAESATTISNPELAEAMKDDPQGAVDFLSGEVSPVKLENVSLDDAGRVVVRDPDFAASIKSRTDPEQEAFVKNGACGAGC